MKKYAALILSLLMALSAVQAAFAQPATATFTHPELGEIIEVSFSHRMPSIKLYGYRYYAVADTEKKPYRALRAGISGIADSKIPSVDKTLTAFFTSIEGRGKEKAPAVMEYTGLAYEYIDQLNALELQQRVEAIKILNGFKGAKGYRNLKGLPGFEGIDAEALGAGYTDYTVEIDGVQREYRVIMFRIVEQDGTFYFERYSFIKIDGVWKLHMITQEYIEEYSERTHYVHGITGSDAGMISEVNQQILRGVAWNAAPGEAAAAEAGTVSGDTVGVNDVLLYRLPSTLSYVYQDGAMVSRTFKLIGSSAYYSAFVSLYMRYADPAVIDDAGTMQWFLEDLSITLRYDSDNPTIEILPRTIG